MPPNTSDLFSCVAVPSTLGGVPAFATSLTLAQLAGLVNIQWRYEQATDGADPAEVPVFVVALDGGWRERALAEGAVSLCIPRSSVAFVVRGVEQLPPLRAACEDDDSVWAQSVSVILYADPAAVSQGLRLEIAPSNPSNRAPPAFSSFETFLDAVVEGFLQSGTALATVIEPRAHRALGPRSGRLYTRATLRRATEPLAAAMTCMDNYTPGAYRSVLAWWSAVSDAVTVWQRGAGKRSGAWIREHTILHYSSTLMALGKLGSQAMLIHSEDWASKTETLKDLRWTLAENPIWAEVAAEVEKSSGYARSKEGTERIYGLLKHFTGVDQDRPRDEDWGEAEAWTALENLGNL